MSNDLLLLQCIVKLISILKYETIDMSTKTFFLHIIVLEKKWWLSSAFGRAPQYPCAINYK